MSWIDVGFLVLILGLVVVDLVMDVRARASAEHGLAYLIGMQQLELQARQAEAFVPPRGARHKLSPPRPSAGDAWTISCACGWPGESGQIHTDASSALDAGETHIRAISRRTA